MYTGLNTISTHLLNTTYRYATFILVALCHFQRNHCFLHSRQVGNILNSHVTYGAILPLNSTHFLRCFKKYVQTEEQWLFRILAENTGTIQVSTIWQNMSGPPGKGTVLKERQRENFLLHRIFSNFHCS